MKRDRLPSWEELCLYALRWRRVFCCLWRPKRFAKLRPPAVSLLLFALAYIFRHRSSAEPFWVLALHLIFAVALALLLEVVLLARLIVSVAPVIYFRSRERAAYLRGRIEELDRAARRIEEERRDERPTVHPVGTVSVHDAKVTVHDVLIETFGAKSLKFRAYMPMPGASLTLNRAADSGRGGIHYGIPPLCVDPRKSEKLALEFLSGNGLAVHVPIGHTFFFVVVNVTTGKETEVPCFSDKPIRIE